MNRPRSRTHHCTHALFIFEGLRVPLLSNPFLSTATSKGDPREDEWGLAIPILYPFL